MIGLTTRMQETLTAIVGHVALHGTTPSQRILAGKIENASGNAQRLVSCLVERGALTRSGGGKTSILAFGSGGVFVSVPPHVAAKLAAHALKSGDSIQSIVEDAITLHLDAADEPVTEDSPA
jgi:hypothetical protein